MQGVVEFLKGWQLHPVVDHFTVALVLVGILIDLVATLAPMRLWIRYMALTLMILGAAAAFGSQVTGGWEAERVWDHLSDPAKELLRSHGWWGTYLPYALGVLALWRIGVQSIGTLARARPIYLLVAIVAGGAILYQADLGGDLVYDYGVGTAPMMKESPTPVASPSMAPQIPAAIPTVYVPPPSPASATPTPTAKPSPVSSASPGTMVNPPPAAPAPTSLPDSPSAKSTSL